MSATLTKLRLQKERAEKEFESARKTMEAAQLAFHQQSKVEGVCPSCLQPDPNGEHHGKCYVPAGVRFLTAAVDVQKDRFVVLIGAADQSSER